MKILLVTPPYQTFFGECKLQPLGIAYVAAVLEIAGYKASILEGTVNGYNANSIFKHVMKIKPAVLGFSIYAHSTFEIATQIINRVKEIDETVFVVLGGPYPTVLHREILRDYPKIDAVIRGEGEYTMVELVEKLEENESLDSILGLSFRKGENIQYTPPRPLIRDLDTLPFPARHLLPSLEKYSKFSQKLREEKIIGTISTSRGCPFHCSFCLVPFLHTESHGRRWRARSPGNVVEEIEQVVQKGAEHIFFVDDNFLVDSKRVVEICNQLRERNFGVTFSFATRVDQLIRNSCILEELKEAGCVQVELGIESGCQTQLNRYGKRTTIGQNELAIKLLRAADIELQADFIMFDPEMRFEELLANLAFIRENGLSTNDGIVFNYLHLLPRMPAFLKLQKAGKLRGSVYNPAYNFDDNRIGMIFGNMQKYVQEFERYRVALLDTIKKTYRKTTHLLMGMKAKKELVSDHETYSEKINVLEKLLSTIAFSFASLKTLPYTFLKTISERAENPNDFARCLLQAFSSVREKMKQEKESIYIVKSELDSYMRLFENP